MCVAIRLRGLFLKPGRTLKENYEGVEVCFVVLLCFSLSICLFINHIDTIFFLLVLGSSGAWSAFLATGVHICREAGAGPLDKDSRTFLSSTLCVCSSRLLVFWFLVWSQSIFTDIDSDLKLCPRCLEEVTKF